MARRKTNERRPAVASASRVVRQAPAGGRSVVNPACNLANHNQAPTGRGQSLPRFRKSFAIAIAVLWWIVTHRDGIAVTTAPTWVQVQKVIWVEIRRVTSLARATGQLILPCRIRPNSRLHRGTTRWVSRPTTRPDFRASIPARFSSSWTKPPGCAAKSTRRWRNQRRRRRSRAGARQPGHRGRPFYEAFTSDRGRWKTPHPRVRHA